MSSPDATRTLGIALGDVVADAVDASIEAAVMRLAERLRVLEPRAVSLREASRLLSCSESTIQRLVAGGHLAKLPHVGARTLIPVTSIDSYCAAAAAAAS